MASGSISHLVVDGEWTSDVREKFAAMQINEIVEKLTSWQSFVSFQPQGDGVEIRKMAFKDFSEKFMDRHMHRHVHLSNPGLVEEPAGVDMMRGRVNHTRVYAYEPYLEEGVYAIVVNHFIDAICKQLQTQREKAQRIVNDPDDRLPHIRVSSHYTVGKTEAFYQRAHTGHAIVTITGENPAHIRAMLYAMYVLFFNGRQRESVIKTCLFQPKDLAFNATDRFILHAAFD